MGCSAWYLYLCEPVYSSIITSSQLESDLFHTSRCAFTQEACFSPSVFLSQLCLINCDVFFLVSSCIHFVEGCAGGDKAITGPVWFFIILQYCSKLLSLFHKSKLACYQVLCVNKWSKSMCAINSWSNYKLWFINGNRSIWRESLRGKLSNVILQRFALSSCGRVKVCKKDRQMNVHTNVLVNLIDRGYLIQTDYFQRMQRRCAVFNEKQQWEAVDLAKRHVNDWKPWKLNYAWSR